MSYVQALKDVIVLLRNSKVKEDGRHMWRDHHNDTIDRLIIKIEKEIERKENENSR